MKQHTHEFELQKQDPPLALSFADTPDIMIGKSIADGWVTGFAQSNIPDPHHDSPIMILKSKQTLVIKTMGIAKTNSQRERCRF